jgi:signal transduction histidine kinase
VKLADRLTQSREELAAAAVKLEAEALELAERNARLARLDAEKARLLDQIRDHDRLRGQLLEKIITAQEDERKRLARELHDQTGQSLTSLLVGLKYVEGARSLDDLQERTAALKQLAVQTIEEVHQLSLALRPAMLDDLGLVVALRALVEDFGRQHGVAARFQADPLERRLPPQVEVTLYRIAQEALTNAAKYARAGSVEVALRVAEGALTLVVADDGVGFDPTALGAGDREHLGLLGMTERVALIGGTFTLDAAPGRGTRVVVTVAPSAAPGPEPFPAPEVPHA